MALGLGSSATIHSLNTNRWVCPGSVITWRDAGHQRSRFDPLQSPVTTAM